MRYGAIGDNLLERAVLASGMAPMGLIDGYAPAFGRAVVLATERGIFDALAEGPRRADVVARSCQLDPRATRKLLDLLVAMRYLKANGGRYELRRHVRRWLLTDRRGSLRDGVLMKRLEWAWIEGLDAFIQDGRPIHAHEDLSTEEWGVYQRGMRAQANLLGPILARAIPVPPRARSMLDIGGSHGHYAAALCRRHRGLRATVLDLPPAIDQIAPILAKEGMGDRVVLKPGDALIDDLGAAEHDLILISGLVHHFDDVQNRRVVEKSARALRPGGILVLCDVLRPEDPGQADQLGAFFDLFFALSNGAGMWTAGQMAAWQRAAGLAPRKPIRLRRAFGFGLQVADKPRGSER